ncbi:hypothetical protein SSP35_41_00110 [Streptomyces sp. NBRC 110611]|uniref:hypothetical protein n=1 Tax=Streptomyces sp. NBRC 110611 TaxID=1621259 RepID=UPI000836090B|nr:hypothetical protein [Streptomyces sp. NBRC 110611]GAU71467.1 hypothetical protein SSP35_41_00110 [Streptomyces sp. NBRC 110611]
MFDLRTEAEMRLYSEKLAKQLALKRHREEISANNADTPTAPPADEGNTQGTGAPDIKQKPL